jgi:hypothetical protein
MKFNPLLNSQVALDLLPTTARQQLSLMAGSRFAYVRDFELPDPLLPTTFFIIRLDGKGFHRFSKAHNFDKPNDVKALTLMNEAARRVMGGRELNGECVLGFGESDEFRCAFFSFPLSFWPVLILMLPAASSSSEDVSFMADEQGAFLPFPLPEQF